MSNRIEQLMQLVEAYGSACADSAIAHAEMGNAAQTAADQAEQSARSAVEEALDRLDAAESEPCRLTHHKRGDGCSIPDCRNYRTVPP